MAGMNPGMAACWMLTVLSAGSIFRTTPWARKVFNRAADRSTAARLTPTASEKIRHNASGQKIRPGSRGAGGLFITRLVYTISG